MVISCIAKNTNELDSQIRAEKRESAVLEKCHKNLHKDYKGNCLNLEMIKIRLNYLMAKKPSKQLAALLKQIQAETTILKDRLGWKCNDQE